MPSLPLPPCPCTTTDCCRAVTLDPSTLRSQLDVARSELEELQCSRAELAVELETARGQTSELKRRVGEEETKASLAADEQRRLTAECEHLRNKAADLERRCDMGATDKQRLDEEAVERQAEADASRRRVQQLEAQLEELKASSKAGVYVVSGQLHHGSPGVWEWECCLERGGGRDTGKRQQRKIDLASL